MASVFRVLRLVFFLIPAMLLLAGAARALPPAIENQPKPEVPRTNQVVLFIVDGLQAEALTSGATPNISGLGMAGVRVDRVTAMPPDTREARIYCLLYGSDPPFDGTNESINYPGGRSLLSLMEKKGLKTALIDGTGLLSSLAAETGYKHPGPFNKLGDVVDAAIDTSKNKKPFFLAVALPGQGKSGTAPRPKDGASVAAAASADNEIGRFIRELHREGSYESTLLIVAGTTGSPPLVMKGSDMQAGFRLPPVGMKDLAPTLGYLFGLNTGEARGLVIWNAIRPNAGRTENGLLQQRVKDLSSACADAVDSSARLAVEKLKVNEEKMRLAGEKLTVEDEIEKRDQHISKLKLTLSIMKFTGMVVITLFLTAMVVEYKILKKKYLFFT